MQIKGPGETGKTQKKSKTGGPSKSGDSTFGSLVSDASETSGAGAAGGLSGLSPAASLQSLLSLQEMDDSTSEEAKARARKRANEMLDKLDEIRLGLLSGGVSARALQDLSRVIAARREEFSDPRLQDIIDEIDLRAQVELAKFERDG